MSSSGVKNQDFSDGMNEGEQICRWVLHRKLQAMKKVYAPNSSGGRAIKEIEDYMAKPIKGFVCVGEEQA